MTNAPAPFSYKSPEWKALRARALLRDLYRCQNCGKNVAGFRRARVDHIKTVRERPDLALTLSNLRSLCIDCDAARHAEKGNRKVDRETIGFDGYPQSGV